jgi:hypothetical protein
MTNKTNKAIIFLQGDSESKNTFNSLIKEKGYWTWNVNNKNYLSFISRQYLGWNGKRTSKFYEFLDEFKTLVDKYWDYETVYTQDLMYKFIKDAKTNVLVFHNVSDNVFKTLSTGEPEQFVKLTLSKTLPTNLDDDIDNIVNVEEEDWETAILDFMKKYIK